MIAREVPLPLRLSCALSGAVERGWLSWTEINYVTDVIERHQQLADNRWQSIYDSLAPGARA